jgi:integrase
MVTVLLQKEDSYEGMLGRIAVRFDYHPDLIEKIKKVKGRNWRPEEGYWTVPDTKTAIEELLVIFQHDNVFIDGALGSFSANIDKRQAVQKNIDEDSQAILDIERQLKLRAYSPKTRKAYRNQIKAFKLFIGGGLAGVDEKRIMDYLFYLADQKQVSESYMDQAVSAIKFPYNIVFKDPKTVAEVPRPRREHKLPEVLSREEIISLLNAVVNLKHRLLLMLTYNCESVKSLV